MTSPMPGRGIRTLEEELRAGCPECRGRGWYFITQEFCGIVADFKNTCPACQGTGKRQDKETGDG